MATATIVERVSDTPQEQPGSRLHFLTRWERFWDWMLGCKPHKWGFPVTTEELKKLYTGAYNSHQTCAACGRTRLYSYPAMKTGPFFEITTRRQP